MRCVNLGPEYCMRPCPAQVEALEVDFYLAHPGPPRLLRQERTLGENKVEIENIVVVYIATR